MFNYKDSNVYVPVTADPKDIRCPKCDSNKRIDKGTCAEGCCDRYTCGDCGYQFVVEWPD
jgi:transposase-like protein